METLCKQYFYNLKCFYKTLYPTNVRFSNIQNNYVQERLPRLSESVVGILWWEIVDLENGLNPPPSQKTKIMIIIVYTHI